MSNSRISNSIPVFNTYINTTDDFLQAISSGIIHNWERLGLSNANATGWQDRRVEWRDTLFVKYSDPLQSTSAVKTQVRNFMDEFRTFAIPLLNIMAASPNATSDDEAVFNFKIGRAEPSHPTSPILDIVVYEAKNIGGGEMQFICRTSHDDHRASLAEGADGVQLAYGIVENQGQPGGGGSGSDIPPAGTLPKETFSKSIFVMHFGDEHTGKKVVVYLRWVNSKHPELNGPWNPVSALVIT